MAIVFSGHDPQWETEGLDQDSFDLPRQQNELIEAVAAVNKNVIIVNSTGVAVSMPWLDKVQGLIQAWFPGQEYGNAIVDVLTGAVNPEGRLPTTFPKAIEDAPAHQNFPGEFVDGQLKVKYEEGVFVGHRHFDRLDRSKLNYPFGYGLSYTFFETADLQAKKLYESEIIVRISVRNAGSVSGGYLVQIYAGRKHQDLDRHPVKSLVGFKKIHLEPQESKQICLVINCRDFAYYDEAGKQWVLEAGEYGFSSGSSAGDISHTVYESLQRITRKV